MRSSWVDTVTMRRPTGNAPIRIAPLERDRHSAVITQLIRPRSDRDEQAPLLDRHLLPEVEGRDMSSERDDCADQDEEDADEAFGTARQQREDTRREMERRAAPQRLNGSSIGTRRAYAS
jgi:hypothetical protein